MSDKLTNEQLRYIKTLANSNDIRAAHVRFMAAEILEYRARLEWMGTNPTEPNPHAAMIAQRDRDRVDYPDFWVTLWQMHYDDDTWVQCALNGDNDYKPYFNARIEYRPHPHRESIIQWHGCSAEDKKRWQWCVNDGYTWINCSASKRGEIYPLWDDSLFYRLRPRTCKITLQNGDVLEYPDW